MKHTPLIAMLGFMSLVAGLPARDADDALRYDIPAKAAKVGPEINRDHTISYHFFMPAHLRTKESWVGTETYDGSRLVQRKLFKNGLKHGLQQTWHRNGQPKSESPYLEGVMHGTFREWNEKGQLIAQYAMVHGMGRKRIYTDEGRLLLDAPMEQSLRNGLCMEWSRHEGIMSFYPVRKGVLTGTACSFYPGGQFRSLSCHSEKRGLHGPFITFSVSGEVLRKKWFRADKEYTEADYARLTEIDHTLPRYYADAMIYQELVDPKVKVAMEGYRRLPLVKIPLELDPSGNLVPRP